METTDRACGRIPGTWPLEQREWVKPGRRCLKGPKPVQWAPSSEPPALAGKIANAQSNEPPDTDPYVRWCGRGGVARRPPIPIFCRAIGGRRRRHIYTLMATAKLNDIDPQAWLADVLARLLEHQ